jgi:hypothetical protein
MDSRTPLTIGCVALALAGLAFGLGRQAGGDSGRLLDGALHHLGDEAVPRWSDALAAPEPSPLRVAFDSNANAVEWVLEYAQRDVSDEWSVAIDGKVLGTLPRSEDVLKTFRFTVPAGTLIDGKNELTVTPVKTPPGQKPGDDILVGRFRLFEKPLRELFSLGRVVVRVTDAAGGAPLPARVTVTNGDGQKVEIFYAEARTTAVRPGVAYTSDGAVSLEVPAGRCVVSATRGMEWSLAQATVEVKAGGSQEVALSLSREVDTTGWIAADTHLHTLTYSGHGDASVEERVVTIAGEGIELAVATDHNHNTEYAPAQRALQLTKYFTPVVGNEVTTDNGHMNAFPLDPAAPVPEYHETDWAKLVANIRGCGAQVVILNHPRWPEKGRDPLTRFGFDLATGGNRAGQRFNFDCLELVNSDAPTQPTRVVLPVWYALLNRGERFPGVGASDSHHVGVIAGQGRTYVPSATDDPAKIDVAAAIRAFKEGRVSVSHGLFATIEVDGRAHMGDLLRVGADASAPADGAAGRSVLAEVTVRHPSWVKPAQLELVVDGAVAATADLAAPQPDDAPTVLRRRVRVPLPAHDAWLVAVAWGEGVKLPCWATELAETCAITNPVWLDGDGDGRCDSPRALAQARVAAAHGDFAALAASVRASDDAVALQLLDLLREAGADGAALSRVAAGGGVPRPALAEWVAQSLAAPATAK